MRDEELFCHFHFLLTKLEIFCDHISGIKAATKTGPKAVVKSAFLLKLQFVQYEIQLQLSKETQPGGIQREVCTKQTVRLEDTHCEAQLNQLNFTVGTKLHLCILYFYTEQGLCILSISSTEITLRMDLFAAIMDRKKSINAHMDVPVFL